MRGVLKHFVLGSIVALSIGACSGGGCTSGCGGITPLPGGFEAEARIENAGALRITDSGFGFLEQNLGQIASGLLDAEGGIYLFAISESSGTIEIPVLPDVDYTVCPGGPTDSPLTCQVEIDLGALALDFAPNGPHHLTVSGPLPIRLQNLPLDTDVGGGNVSINQPRNCPGSPSDPFANINATVRISLEADVDPSHSRKGYSRLRIEDISIDTGQLEDQIAVCGGFAGTVADFFRGFIIDQVGPGLIDTLKEAVEDQLCQAANPDVDPPCPTGTNDIEGTCRYGTDAESDCVSTVLGTDGHAELGGLLSSISPGTEGGLDFILAAGGEGTREDGSGLWGDLDPIGGGATVGMYGGVEPRPVSNCVPLSTLAKPTGIPMPDELRLNTVPGWPGGFPRPGSVGPDVSVALSEDFFNYALSGMYNSGLLCIGITTETIGDILNTGTVGIFAASLRDLTLQRENAPIAIVLRPTTAPRVEFGNGTDIATDPNLRLNLDGLAFDFYVWSLDRFLRVFTAKFDLEVPANLEITEEGLVPVIQDIGVTNGVVENSELLAEDPQQLADALASLISGQVGSLLAGGIPPVDISGALESFGLRLALPPSTAGQGSPGIRKLTKGQHDYLGIFAGLESVDVPPAVTDAWLIAKHIDVDGLRAGTVTASNGPVIVIGAQSEAHDGTLDGDVEFQAKVDHGPWKPFVRGTELRVRDEALRVEGRHTIQVRGRAVGKPYSLDMSPAEVEVVIDTVAPDLAVDRGPDGALAIDAFDVITDQEDLVGRLALGGDAFGQGAAHDQWLPLDQLASQLREIDEDEAFALEVRDQEGNVASASQAIIRGAPRGDSDEGCGCEVPGGSKGSRGVGAAGVLALGALAAAVARRRRSSALRSRALKITVAAAALTTIATAPACSCDETDPANTTSSASAGGGGGGMPSCEDCISLEPGLIGSYTSAAVDGDGNIWVAGYSEANWIQGYTYGDLVVGQWDGDKVKWEIVDGVPDDPPVDPEAYDTSSFRGGQPTPGDDVGLWTSIAVNGDGEPAVAYYDRTNRQLKLAVADGNDWSVSVVESAAGGDVGRYAELWFEGDTPVIAYQAVLPTATGFATSKVRVARGGSSGGFQFEDVVVDVGTPCREHLCSAGSVCVADTLQCTATGTGCADCGDDQECVASGAGAPACADVIGDGKLDTYPTATGLYISSAKAPDGSVGLVWYDRVAGTLVGAKKVAGAWVAQTIDGDTDPPVDVGIGATLAIDVAGSWHVAYVDGFDESLKYARLTPDGSVAAREVVDDGVSVGGAPFADGKHIVGDDASIDVAGNGEVRIAYQDATAGKLRIATGTPSGDVHTWALAAVEGEGVRGAFNEIVTAGNDLQVVHWWRTGGAEPLGDVAVTKP